MKKGIGIFIDILFRMFLYGMIFICTYILIVASSAIFKSMAIIIALWAFTHILYIDIVIPILNKLTENK